MQTKRSKILLALVVAMIPLAGVVAKDNAQPGHFPSFSQMDANHDGMLSRSEVPADLHDLRMHFRDYALVGSGISPGMYAFYVATYNNPKGRWVVISTTASP